MCVKYGFAPQVEVRPVLHGEQSGTKSSAPEPGSRSPFNRYCTQRNPLLSQASQRIFFFFVSPFRTLSAADSSISSLLLQINSFAIYIATTSSSSSLSEVSSVTFYFHISLVS